MLLEVANSEVEPLDRILDVVEAVAGEVVAVNHIKDQRDFVLAVAATNIWLKHLQGPNPVVVDVIKKQHQERDKARARNADCQLWRFQTQSGDQEVTEDEY